MAAFVIVAALMLIAALAFVLPALLGKRGADPAQEAQRKLRALEQAHAEGILSDAEYAAKRQALGEQLLLAVDVPPARARGALPIALGVALLLPALAIVLYRVVGTPQAVDFAGAPGSAAPSGHEQNMDQAIAGLEEKLKQNPDDAEGWALLGRAYEATEHFAQARDALKRAHDLAPDSPDVDVAYAEALALSGDAHRLDGEARALLEAALKNAPDNQRGLWLYGISDYQAKNYDAAIASWKHLLSVLPKDAPVVRSVQHEIATAEAARDGKPLPPPLPEDEGGADSAQTADAAPNAPAPTAAGASGGPHLTIKVALDAKLKSKLAPDDVLFVYAKAASGPPMPLAIQRMKASELPATVVLTDGMGMMPSMKLSQFKQVIVGARVSKSGNAIAQSGDLQTVSAPLAVDTTAPIDLTIDHVVP